MSVETMVDALITRQGSAASNSAAESSCAPAVSSLVASESVQADGQDPPRNSSEVDDGVLRVETKVDALSTNLASSLSRFPLCDDKPHENRMDNMNNVLRSFGVDARRQ